MKTENVKNIYRCWKRIGVWGHDSPTCPELPKVTHCRNCTVYIQAGRGLLEQKLPADYRQECTDVLTEKKEIELIGTISVVIFKISSEWFALPTGIFAEAIEPMVYHTVPHRLNSVLIGIINVHGEIQLCVSLQALFELDKNDNETNNNSQRMLVLNKDGEKWVFPVNHIHGIFRLNPNILQNTPANVARAKSTFTKAIFKWDDHQVSLLDEELLIYRLTRSVK